MYVATLKNKLTGKQSQKLFLTSEEQEAWVAGMVEKFGTRNTHVYEEKNDPCRAKMVDLKNGVELWWNKSGDEETTVVFDTVTKSYVDVCNDTETFWFDDPNGCGTVFLAPEEAYVRLVW